MLFMSYYTVMLYVDLYSEIQINYEVIQIANANQSWFDLYAKISFDCHFRRI